MLNAALVFREQALTIEPKGVYAASTVAFDECGPVSGEQVMECKGPTAEEGGACTPSAKRDAFSARGSEGDGGPHA